MIREQEESIQTVKRVPRWLIGLLISAAALVLAIAGIRPERFFNELQNANYGYLLPAALLTLIGLFARARSWQVLVGSGLSLRRSFFALNEGYLLNTVLPLRLGELGRAYLVTKGSAIHLGWAMASVVVERMIDALVSFAGLAVALPFVIGAPWARQVASGVGLVLLVAFLGLSLLSSQRVRIARWIARFLGSRRDFGLAQTADDFMAGLEAMLQPAIAGQAGFWSLFAWVTTWLQLPLFLMAFNLQGGWVAMLFVTGVTAFGSALPSSPGAIGVFELAAVAGLRAMGYAHESALSTAIIWHGLTLLITSLIGAWALAREGETLGSLASAIENFFKGISPSQTT